MATVQQCGLLQEQVWRLTPIPPRQSCCWCWLCSWPWWWWRRRAGRPRWRTAWRAPRRSAGSPGSGSAATPTATPTPSTASGIHKATHPGSFLKNKIMRLNVVLYFPSERLIKRTADAMVTAGYREAGYTFVMVDDCWSAKQRDQAQLKHGSIHILYSIFIMSA